MGYTKNSDMLLRTKSSGHTDNNITTCKISNNNIIITKIS